MTSKKRGYVRFGFFEQRFLTDAIQHCSIQEQSSCIA
jgi:hypothetical protein